MGNHRQLASVECLMRGREKEMRGRRERESERERETDIERETERDRERQRDEKEQTKKGRCRNVKSRKLKLRSIHYPNPLPE